MTSNIFATLFNFNKLHICGIRNPRTTRDTRATNYLRINASGHFLVVRESLFNMTMGGGSGDEDIKGGSENLYTLHPKGLGAPKKLNH